jgi:hypothetical protein
LREIASVAPATAAAHTHSAGCAFFAEIGVLFKARLQWVRIERHVGLGKVAFLPWLHRLTSHQRETGTEDAGARNQRSDRSFHRHPLFARSSQCRLNLAFEFFALTIFEANVNRTHLAVGADQE